MKKSRFDESAGAPRGPSRRSLLRTGASLAALGTVRAAWGATAETAEPKPAAPRGIADERDPYVPRPNRTEYVLDVARITKDPDGKKAVPSIVVNGSLPGPEIRVREGDLFRALVQNRLDGPTSIHWHGLLVPAGMDGVPDISNAPIAAGQVYVYEYPLLQTGTYWYHSHVGFQEQVGLFGPFVIEPREESLRVDHDAVVMLSDWLHRPPLEVFAALRGATPAASAGPAATPAGMGDMGDMTGKSAMPTQGAMTGTAAMPTQGAMGKTDDMGGMGQMGQAAAAKGGGADLSDVKYDAFLLNGRAMHDPWTLAARPGEKIRLRLVNAGSSTYFKVALDGHPLQVTHADGLAVEPVTVDHLLMGMAECYDVVVTLGKPGSYTLHAVAQDGSGQAIGVLHTPDAKPAPNREMPAFDGRLLEYAALRAPASTVLPPGEPRRFRLPLQGDMARYVWMIDGQAWPKAEPLRIRRGERVELEMVNQTMMWHPMHLHGHFFRVLQGAGDRAPLKHTVNVAPGETVRIEFTADNPGRWFFHCHNLYHLEAGMAREFIYEA